MLAFLEYFYLLISFIRFLKNLILVKIITYLKNILLLYLSNHYIALILY